MAIIAGIDEAGLGPVIGPLVVSASVFRVPDEFVRDCMWTSLGVSAVCRKGFGKSSAMPVADSKALRVRTDGVIHLERGVLGMLQLNGTPAPAGLLNLMDRIAPSARQDVREYPWYNTDLALPLQADATDIGLRANAVHEAMQRCGIKFEGVRCVPVFEGHYNRLIQATRNKSVALFGVVGQLIAWAFALAEGDCSRIVVDRQGGRMRYVPVLQQMFEGAQIKVVQESATASIYQIRQQGKCVEVAFVVEGEQDALPVALASMVSKYVRELYMELLNGWWRKLVPELPPTAGYHVDGWRFIKAIEPMMAQHGIDRALLVRCR